MSSNLIQSPEEITSTWLQTALTQGLGHEISNIRGVELSPVGTGTNAFGVIARCKLDYQEDRDDQPSSVIVKLPSTERNHLFFAKRLQLHQRECAFYRLVSDAVPVKTPRIYYNSYDHKTDRFVLVMEDLGNLLSVPQVEGLSESQTLTTIRTLARLHGTFWRKTEQEPIVSLFNTLGKKYIRDVQTVFCLAKPIVYERFGDYIPQRTRDILDRFGPEIDTFAADAYNSPRTLVHGDLRSENLFFNGSGEELTVIDWQGCGTGNGFGDVAYLLSTTITSEVRKRVERDAIREYHDVLVECGVHDLSLEDCLRGYQQGLLSVLIIAMFVGGTLNMDDERMVRLLVEGTQRIASALEDLDVEEFIPRSNRSVSYGKLLSSVANKGYAVYRAFK